jgi:hypothetical protein
MWFTPTFGAEFFDRTDKDGHDHVAIKLVNQAENGQREVFWADLDRLEEVVRRAEAFWQMRQDGGPEERAERVGDYAVSFFGWPPNGQSSRAGMRLEQFEKGQWQEFTTDIERLKSAIEFGRGVEQELGCTQRWHTLAYAASVTNDELGQVHARVFKNVESPEQARKLLANNAGLVLFPEPTRRPLEEGAEINVPRDVTIQLTNGSTRSIGEHAERNEVVREATGEHFLVARWHDVSRLPREGDRVTWEGATRSYNGEPDYFRAHPAGRAEQGEPEEPIYVLIRKEDGRLPGHGVVEAVSLNRKEMVAELDRQERIQQAITTHFHEQSFGMDRREHTQGYSM